jgi:hypothetical protein
VTVTLISISHLSSSPLIPNVKCIAWNFDGSNFVSEEDEDEDLKKLRFENGDTIPDVKNCFNIYKIFIYVCVITLFDTFFIITFYLKVFKMIII